MLDDMLIFSFWRVEYVLDVLLVDGRASGRQRALRVCLSLKTQTKSNQNHLSIFINKWLEEPVE